ncbi:hypothetical protein HYZ97_05050 [Candidatus Pacearchaeota archaeon]|nr:hypothetical protein [Candidatus Pacearchaeota archaeon]
MHSKRGLSDVVTTVLIILLVVAAVASIWVFIQPTLKSAGSRLTNGASNSTRFPISGTARQASLSAAFNLEDGSEQVCTSPPVPCSIGGMASQSDTIGGDSIPNPSASPGTTGTSTSTSASSPSSLYQTSTGASVARYNQSTSVLSLSEGVHYLVLPKDPSDRSLNSLFPSVPTQTAFSILRADVWQTRTSTGQGFTNNPSPGLQAGEGFMFEVKREYSFVVQGPALDAPVSVQLNAGQNLFGVPYCPGSFSYSASDVLKELSSLNKPCTIIAKPAVISSAEEWYSTDALYQAPGIENDFMLNRIGSYRLTCGSSMSAFAWTPQCE